MGRGRRRFDLFSIGMADVELFGAWDGKSEIRFSYADTRHFRLVCRSNTQLFDALTDICGLPYCLSDDVLMDFLYEVIIVDMRLDPELAYVRCSGGSVSVGDAQKLPRAMYDHGFTISGLPSEAAHGEDTVHYVPFISPASMSRKGSYLFVNEKRFDALLRALTLDLLVSTDRGQPAVSDDVGGKDFISVHKLAAYVGNSYSDGTSLRELRFACAAAGREDACSNDRLGLCAANTVCVADFPWFHSGMERFDYYWAHEDVERNRSLPSDDVVLPAWLSSEDREGLESMFRALNDSLDAFLAAVPDETSTVWAAWKRLIAEYFALSQRPKLELRDALLPVPARDGTVLPLMRYCVVYAAVIADEGEPSTYYADPAAGVQSWQRLEKAVDEFCSAEKHRRRLHKKARDTLSDEDRVGGVTCCWQNDGLYAAQGKAPRFYQRARLCTPDPEDDVETHLYDGVGFLSDECFDRLGMMLGDDGGNLNAIQVRLPWCKGLLVRFSFTRFFADWAGAHDLPLTELQITDVFGVKRRLFDEDGSPCVQALFTQSMFKGTDWFKNLKTEEDRWGVYWQRMEEHDIPLLIAGRDTPARSSSRLNYQFVSTGGMTAAMLGEMVREQMDAALAAMDDPDKLARLLFSGQEEEVSEDMPEPDEAQNGMPGDEPDDASGGEDADDGAGGESETSDDYQKCIAEAVRRHGSVLMQTRFVYRKTERLIRSEAVQLMRGRLSVKGDMRYALPDLLEMCVHLAKNCLEPKRKQLPACMDVQRLNTASPAHVHGWYYAPGMNTKPGQTGGAVAVLRNPHYAPGEEPVLQVLPDDSLKLYDRYFSGLQGCIMMPAVSLLTVNGADSDGDRVNVCADARVLTSLAAQAKKDNALWRRMIEARGETESFLRAEADAQRDAELAGYLRHLADELSRILPDRLPGGSMGTCAPLLYAGRRRSDNRKNTGKSSKFRPGDLRGNHLASHLWAAFSQSGEQSIGSMSLDLLDLAAMAYREDDGTTAASLGPKELLSRFLPRYLVIQSALDTALEIDMAKSGLRRVDSPVKRLPASAVKYFGMRGGDSNYRIWQQLYKKQRGELNGPKADQALRELMRQYQKKCKSSVGSILPLEMLPETVYAYWTENHRSSDELHRLGHALALPRWPDEKAEEYHRRSLQLAAQMQPRIIACNRRSARRASMDGYHLQLTEKHVLAMRWLLGAGYPLQKAHALLDDMRSMLDTWRVNLDVQQLDEAISRINALVMSDERAAEWGWAAEEKRRGLLKAMMTLPDGTVLDCPEALAKCMCAHPRGILMLKHVIRYAGTELKCRVDETSAALTSEGLAAELHRLAEAFEPDEALRGEMFYHACRLLSLGRFQGNGAYISGAGVLNDFQTTYLLRDELSARIVDVLPEKESKKKRKK